MIKGIFFDFDGVITLEKQGTPPMIAYIAKTTGLPTETVEKAYRRHNRALLMGEVTHLEMWQPFCEELETVIDYDILKGAFLNITLDREVVDYIRELPRISSHPSSNSEPVRKSPPHQTVPPDPFPSR